jgi:hypothetical protein
MAYSSIWMQRHPDLFVGLTEEANSRIAEILAEGRIEGWEPSREEIADLIAYDLGRISEEEYTRRGDARIQAAYGRTRPAGG